MSQSLSLSPAGRFALIIDGLCSIVASCGGRAGLGEAFPTPRLPSPLVTLIWAYLRRVKLRFTRHAGAPPAPSRKRRPPATPRIAKRRLLPRRRSWLMILIPQTTGYASQLQHFLTEPDVEALLRDTPQLRRTLRPLCRMLKTPLPPILQPPPDAAPAVPQAEPQPAPPQAAAPPGPLAEHPPAAVSPQATPPPRAPPIPA